MYIKHTLKTLNLYETKSSDLGRDRASRVQKGLEIRNSGCRPSAAAQRAADGRTGGCTSATHITQAQQLGSGLSQTSIIGDRSQLGDRTTWKMTSFKSRVKQKYLKQQGIENYLMYQWDFNSRFL